MRMRRHFLGWVGVTWVLATVCSCLFGAYLESDQPEAVRDDAPAVEPPRRVIPPKPLPPPDNAVASLIGRVRVERPHTYRHLTVFPLSLKRPSDLDEICTFAEAVRRDWIVIRESRDARVPVVMVRNDSMRHILLLGGELLVGGKQNRAVRNDVLLPPLSSFIEVPVYCVEKGRWQGTQDAFGKAPALVHPTLRLEAAAGAPQDSIWRDIQAKSSRLGVSPATGDYHHVRESGAVKAQMGDIARHFRRVPRSGRVGVVVTAGDRILGCDLFSDERLFDELWDQIIQSYVFDYITCTVRERREVSGREVRRFLDRVLSARVTERSTPGVGRFLQLSRTVDGAALVWRDAVVHLVLGADDRYYPLPLEREEQ